MVGSGTAVKDQVLKLDPSRPYQVEGTLLAIWLRRAPAAATLSAMRQETRRRGAELLALVESKVGVPLSREEFRGTRPAHVARGRVQALLRCLDHGFWHWRNAPILCRWR
jgi:hypothetical protein